MTEQPLTPELEAERQRLQRWFPGHDIVRGSWCWHVINPRVYEALRKQLEASDAGIHRENPVHPDPPPA